MKLAILAEQNFNLIDGSTIWLLNLCKLVALLEDVEATVLLRHALTDRILADEVPSRVRLIDAQEMSAHIGQQNGIMEPEFLGRSLKAWERKHGKFDRFLVRGEAYLLEMLNDPGLAPRVIGYAPGLIPDVSQPEPEWLGLARAQRSPIIVQSAPAKCVLESLCDYPAHVVHVVPPIVFHEASSKDMQNEAADRPTVLCYSGKVDHEYGLDWLVDLGRRMSEQPGLGLSVIAGKDTWRSRNPDFFRLMDGFRADVAAGRLPHVRLASNLAHAEAKARMGEADFAWCLRHARYDDVIEISTKIVEFCALGVTPILNDTALNRDLFGADYPYLVNLRLGQDAEIAPLVLSFLKGRGSAEHDRAKARVREVAARFSADQLSGALGRALRGHNGGEPPIVDRPRHILLATHDPKFLRQFLDRVQNEPDIRITHEPWASTEKPVQPPKIPEDADTVFCEWCCGNAVWHSRNKRPGTRLIVRLHRFEAFREFPKEVDWNAVDALIVVSEHFRDLMIERFGVDPARVHVMPQYIDFAELQRPKLPSARFTLGLVGINPFGHKRFDRAIDFFAALRARDPRFQLAVRSVMPWQIGWVWRDNVQDRERFLNVFRRISSDPLLAGAVRFDPAGPDMEEWYRGIGVILSSSDTEGCHTSVMEGMASGAMPVVYDWPGARSLFSPWVHADMRDAIDDVIAFAQSDPTSEQRRVFSELERRHDVAAFVRQFFQL